MNLDTQTAKLFRQDLLCDVLRQQEGIRMRRASFQMHKTGMDEFPGARVEVDVLDFETAREETARRTHSIERLG